jgi:hypothetical protein
MFFQSINMFAVCWLAIPMLTEVASGRTLLGRISPKNWDDLTSRIQPAIFTEWSLSILRPVASKVMFFLRDVFLTRLKWSLSPFPKFRYVSSNLPEAGPSFGQFFWICARLRFLGAYVRSFLQISCITFPTGKRCRNRKMLESSRINDFCSGRFFFYITKTRFTWRKIDLRIEQVVGRKFTSHWGFLNAPFM